jgi:predicted transcriptional regulator
MRTGKLDANRCTYGNITICMLVHYTKNACNVMTDMVADRFCTLCVPVEETRASSSSCIEGRMEAATYSNGEKIQLQCGTVSKAITIS